MYFFPVHASFAPFVSPSETELKGWQKGNFLSPLRSQRLDLGEGEGERGRGREREREREGERPKVSEERDDVREGTQFV